MLPNFTFELKYLSDEFESYVKTQKASSPELAAFFDGFLLKQSASDASTPAQTAQKLIQLWRHFGFSHAKINPLKEPDKPFPISYEISPDTALPSLGLFDEPSVTIKELNDRLKDIYGGSIGYEFLHCSFDVIQTITSFIEKPKSSHQAVDYTKEYELLASSSLFESFLHTRFPGQKRFSLEGLETGILLIDHILECAATKGYKKAFFGMSHRGRLNLLANLLNKPLSDIFEEFSKEHTNSEHSGMGDVKYHKGAECVRQDGFQLTLSSNPSHLEAVDPVILGMAYAGIQTTSQKALTFMIHGDAAFAGQGVVYETMQMSKIKGYDVGGVTHIIFNNQIGFTAMPEESRSTMHASDLAKAFNCPIFHVNSEDVDSMRKVAELCVLLKDKHGIDVMIDLIGYRRWGHNESDEPSFTQPLLYQSLKNRPSLLEIYKQKILKENISHESLSSIESGIKERLQTHFETKSPAKKTNPSVSKDSLALPSLQQLQTLAEKIFTMPQNIGIHPKLGKLLEERKKNVCQDHKVDFPTAEALAFAYALDNSYSLRLDGQDAQRGTFSQRHVVIVDQINEKKYCILTPCVKSGQSCEIINSVLSEYAACGFEYGFSKINPRSLTLWEAQFGDFANGAQIIIDQFIASGKTKWQDRSNLTLLLPHGYEGQGPEHSSARIERFLELAAEDNMKIACPVFPSTYFHMLKEQCSSDIPLIVFTPKALLRHTDAISSLDLMTKERQSFIDDHQTNAKVTILCYGKIYFDLIALKKEAKLNHISIIALEVLYPLDKPKLDELLKARSQSTRLVLVQDEPLNMGAASYLKMHFEHLHVIARPFASSPATGYSGRHAQELQDILMNVKSL